MVATSANVPGRGSKRSSSPRLVWVTWAGHKKWKTQGARFGSGVQAKDRSDRNRGLPAKAADEPAANRAGTGSLQRGSARPHDVTQPAKAHAAGRVGGCRNIGGRPAGLR